MRGTTQLPHGSASPAWCQHEGMTQLHVHLQTAGMLVATAVGLQATRLLSQILGKTPRILKLLTGA